MNRKYDMRICKCGRIHMIPTEKIEKALEDNKNLLLIWLYKAGYTGPFMYEVKTSEYKEFKDPVSYTHLDVYKRQVIR